MSELAAWMDKLEAMGPDGIASFLRTEGVTGRRGAGRQCPLANFLSVKLGSQVCVFHSVTFPSGVDFCRGCTPNGPNIREFIDRFDDGAYPHLVGPALIKPALKLVEPIPPPAKSKAKLLCANIA